MYPTRLLRRVTHYIWECFRLEDEMKMRLRNEAGNELHVEEMPSDLTVTIRYFTREEAGELVKAMEVTCFVARYGDWIPLSLYREGQTSVFATADAEYAEATVIDSQAQAQAAGFCDVWAMRFLEEGFLATAARLTPLGVATAKRPKWPKPTVPPPDLEQIEEWMFEDGGCEATDACWVEVDGVCPHGHPSWLLRLGLI